MDRRGFLGIVASAGLVGLAGCTSSSPGPTPTGTGVAPTPLPSDDDDELRRITFTAEQELVGLYASAIVGADSELAAQLRSLQVQHVEHAQRLRPEIPVSTDPPAPTPSATPSPTVVPADPQSGAAAGPSVSVEPGQTGAPTPSPTPTPRPATVLATLRRAEQAALTQRSAACERAGSADLARDLCLIAASEGQHVDVLRRWGSELAR